MSSSPKSKFFRTLSLLLLGIIGGYYLGINQVNFVWKNYQPKISVQNKLPPKVIEADFSLFWDVWGKVTKNYVDKKVFNSQKMVYGAISGMVASLGDPYTVFLPPEQNTQIKKDLSGQFEGIGAQLGVKDKKIVVVAPLLESPAEKIGIKAGDFIFKVDGVDITNWSLPETVNKIRGPKGTTVKLTIFRQGEDKPREFSIIRETIHIKSAEGKIEKWQMVNGQWKTDEKCDKCQKVAYLRLSQFGDETNNEWLIAVNDFLNQNKAGSEIRGLVLDLRNNSGGYLNGAVFIASEFIKSGTVVIKETGDGQRENFEINRKGVLLDLPVVVLINKGSASASEIVAGALRDNRGAKLIGEASFGKGTIQEVQDLGGGAGLHITVAKWLTPKGEWVNGKGLEPDIKVSLDEKDPTRDFQLEKAVGELLKL